MERWEQAALRGHGPATNTREVLMAKADLGLKRTCLSCGMRYYDFNRTPIVCPGCQTEFDPEAVIRSRRGRASSKDTEKGAKAAPSPAADDVADKTEDNEAAAESGAEGVDEDEAVGFDNDDIDPENDDSAGLISNDLDEDEEILPGIPKEDE